jgi:hypothetical protein
MIILVIDRKSNLHLVDYTPLSGNKFTICGEIYRKKEIVTTLALDNTIHNICRTCYEDYETMYGDDLDFDPRMARTSLNKKMRQQYFDLLFDQQTPELKYYDIVRRRWDRLNRYRKKVLRK